jgi:hypothetical protein
MAYTRWRAESGGVQGIPPVSGFWRRLIAKDSRYLSACGHFIGFNGIDYAIA